MVNGQECPVDITMAYVSSGTHTPPTGGPALPHIGALLFDAALIKVD